MRLRTKSSKCSYFKNLEKGFPWCLSGKEGMCAQSCPTLCAAWTVGSQAPLCLEFSRQEYWSGVPFPSPGNLPNPVIKAMSLACPTLAGRFFTSRASRKNEGKEPKQKQHPVVDGTGDRGTVLLSFISSQWFLFFLLLLFVSLCVCVCVYLFNFNSGQQDKKPVKARNRGT